MAKGLQFYLQREREKKNVTIPVFGGCEATRDFTLQVNNMFDALNRSHAAEGIRKGGKDLQVGMQ